MSSQVQSDQYIPAEDIYGEMTRLEQLLDSLEQRGVELEKKLRDNPNGNARNCRKGGKTGGKDGFPAPTVHRIC